MRWAVLIAFLVLLSGASFYRMEHLPKAATPFVASHALEKNHLIVVSDLDLPPLTGRYVSRPIAAHAAIEGLVEGPELAAPAQGSILVAMPVDRALIQNGTINQGTPVRLCRGATVVVTKPLTFPVATVMCPQTGACSALVEAPADQAASFVPAATGGPTALSAKPCG